MNEPKPTHVKIQLNRGFDTVPELLEHINKMPDTTLIKMWKAGGQLDCEVLTPAPRAKK